MESAQASRPIPLAATRLRRRHTLRLPYGKLQHMARVALAEHSPEIRNLVSLTLKGAGHHVDLFSDGAATLLALGERSYDLLICDVAIPKLDGISLCRAVRKRTASREMPIVLLSPRPLGQLTLDGYEAGADDFIETPCAASLLRSRVDQALRSSRDWELATRLPELGPQIGLPARYDRYELQELLGRGGFSTVYRGVDPNGQEVALKLFKGGMVENRVALGRFFREVATLRDLNSPGIVPVLGSGFAQGRFYIAIETDLGTLGRRALVRAWAFRDRRGVPPRSRRGPGAA